MKLRSYKVSIGVAIVMSVLNIGAYGVDDLCSIMAASDDVYFTLEKSTHLSLLARAVYTSLIPEGRAWAMSYADCDSFCQKEYPGIGWKAERNRKHCMERICLGECSRLGVEPCTTPAWDPTRPPVARCKCGEECCSVSAVQGEKDQCCREVKGLEMCIRYDQECCATERSVGSCEYDEECCVTPEGGDSTDQACCKYTEEQCCVDAENVACCKIDESCCYGNDGITCCSAEEDCTINDGCCATETCGFESGLSYAKDCCPPDQICCGDTDCCPIEECIDDKCICHERCGDKCCTSGETCHEITNPRGEKQYQCCTSGESPCGPLNAPGPSESFLYYCCSSSKCCSTSEIYDLWMCIPDNEYCCPNLHFCPTDKQCCQAKHAGGFTVTVCCNGNERCCKDNKRGVNMGPVCCDPTLVDDCDLLFTCD